MGRSELIKVFDDSLEYIKNTLKESTEISKANTKVIKGLELSNGSSEKGSLDNISISKKKTFEAALSYDDIMKVAVLNFASATNPGGGVLNGSSAQEECLCRCSNLYSCLSQERIFKEYYQKNRNLKNPLHTDDIIYSPSIVIFKDDYKYSYLEKNRKVDVISCAAPNLREHPSNQYNTSDGEKVEISDDDLYKLHVNRAKNILKAAIDNNVQIIILGAFGCGAFKNNPNIVARAYKDVLSLQKYNQFFHVEFAIYGDEKNYKAFKEEFE